jgi:hypothetical protein
VNPIRWQNIPLQDSEVKHRKPTASASNGKAAWPPGNSWSEAGALAPLERIG